MELPPSLRECFPPSATELLKLARSHIDDEMLLQIARADHGSGADKAFAALRVIRDEGIVPRPVSYELSEVLCLSRWHDLHAWNVSRDHTDPLMTRGHFIRFFACAALLHAKADPSLEFPEDSIDSDFAMCLQSAGMLGDDFNKVFGSWLTWLMQSYHLPNINQFEPEISTSESDSRAARMKAISEWLKGAHLGCEFPDLVGMALLTLALRMKCPEMDEHAFDQIAAWILQLNQIQGEIFGTKLPSDPKPLLFSFQQGFWTPTVIELLERTKSIANPSVRENIELCALLLETGF